MRLGGCLTPGRPSQPPGVEGLPAECRLPAREHRRGRTHGPSWALPATISPLTGAPWGPQPRAGLCRSEYCGQ